MVAKKGILVCINPRSGGPACIGEASREVFRAFRKRAKERGVDIQIDRNVCMGYCSHGPNVKILGGPFFHEVTVDDVDRILDLASQ